MAKAYCAIRTQPHYRHEAFIKGLRTCGYHVLHEQLPAEKPGPGDIMVIWNRYSDREATADKWERQGGKVLVAENGYLGHDDNGVQLYAMSVHGHCGSGRWPAGGPERFAALGVTLKPWRQEGGHIVVNLQRGIGSKSMASPADWPQRIQQRLKKVTARKVVIRPHPGDPANHPKVVAEQTAALQGAHACVVWSSANGVRALAEGIPVFYDAPHWILAGAAKRGVEDIEAPLLDDSARQNAFERMAWAQWTVSEIASGEAFKRLMEVS